MSFRGSCELLARVSSCADPAPPPPSPISSVIDLQSAASVRCYWDMEGCGDECCEAFSLAFRREHNCSATTSRISVAYLIGPMCLFNWLPGWTLRVSLHAGGAPAVRSAFPNNQPA